MSLISVIDAHLNNGADKLLEGANFSIEDGERVCLVGRNGTGKSTLTSVLHPLPGTTDKRRKFM